jgi:hypothetical protein
LSAGMTDGEIDGFLDAFAGVVKNQIAAGHNGDSREVRPRMTKASPISRTKEA